MEPVSSRHIVILGAGYSGTMVAVHLLAAAPPGLRVSLVERRPSAGLGVAYGTGRESHLLNVPAGRMSAYPDRPGDFLEWLGRQPEGAGLEAGSFAPRKLYGRYLREQLEAARKQARASFEIIHDEAIELFTAPSRARVVLRSGRELEATQVVLALGNPPPASPPARGAAQFYSSRRYSAHAWSPDALAGVESGDTVLLIGTGLTMIDLALSLDESGHCGPIEVVSRRGLLPQRAVPAQAWPAFLTMDDARLGLRHCLRRVREEVAKAAAQGADWRSVFDSLRPDTQALWAALAADEKRRFLRHVRPFWEVHRHRVPPQTAQRLEKLLAAGRLRFTTGRIEAFMEDWSGVDVVVRRRVTGERVTIRAQRVVNCTGPESNYRNLHHPLLVSLLEQGLARADALALGLDVAPDGALVGADGRASGRLFTLGPARKGSLWETTAVPELRVQARELAARLLAP